MRGLLTAFVNALLSAQADAVCGAGYNERTPQRVNSRNGYRHRDLDTRVNTLDVAVPKLRQGSLYPEWLLVRRKRAERALTSVWRPAACSASRPGGWTKLVQTLGTSGLSKSQVSVMATQLDTSSSSAPELSPMPVRSSSWPPMRWCSRFARAAGWCRCTC